jgi:hypothetical protein
MRIFNTVQELWSHCLFCPLCQVPSRTITLQVGPDDQFTLDGNIPYHRIGSDLLIYSSFQIDRQDPDYVKGNIATTHIINCVDNTFELQVSDTNPLLAEKAKKSYFYFYVYANCSLCDNSYVNSTDIEFDPEKKIVYNLQMDREGYYLLSEEDSYHVTTSHDRHVVMVSRVEVPETGVRIDNEKVLELPFFNLDVSNLSKAINKIKTLILFS